MIKNSKFHMGRKHGRETIKKPRVIIKLVKSKRLQKNAVKTNSSNSNNYKKYCILQTVID